MTAAKFFLPSALRTPSDVAPYFRHGADYVVDVAEAMDRDVGDLPERIDRAEAAMRDDDLAVDDDIAALIGAVLVGDAEFWRPLGGWLPRGYALMMRGFDHPVRRKLLRMAGRYTDTLDVDGRLDHLVAFHRAYPSVREGFGAPLFSRPADHPVDGRPATRYVDGFDDRVVLGDAVLHVEWYRWVADRVGVPVDEALCDRAIAETVPYLTGHRERLPDDVARFQRALFVDSDWIRGVHDHYELSSWLWRRTATAIEGFVAEELADGD